MTWKTAHCVLRPDVNGKWYIQNDSTHAPEHIDLYVQQTADYVRIYTSGLYGISAGVIHITSDDGFGPFISGYGNLGLNTSYIRIYAGTTMIDPADVWGHLPPDRKEAMNGNLWVSLKVWEE